MPLIEREGQRIFYEVSGSGPTIVLGHSTLCSGEMWAGQVPALDRSHRVVNIDYRGHGQSSTVEQDITLDDLIGDSVAILDELGVERAIWVGLSVGGMVALRAALTVPDRVMALVVADASAAAEPFYPKLKYRSLGIGARLFGMRPFVPLIAPVMFGRTTLKENRGLVEEWAPSVLTMELPSILRFLEAVLKRESLVDRLSDIDCPALIVVGEEDRTQPPSRSRQIAARVPGASLEVIPRAGHLSALEQPAVFNRALLDFLRSLGSR